MMESASTLQICGAIGFGAIIGWYVYYINRNRTDKVQMNDILTLVGAIGGAAVLSIFPAKSELFGAYGIGLFAGFFAYFSFLLLWVRISEGFTFDWFLDGRRPKLGDDEEDGPAGMGGGEAAD
jgi:uncharacterized membrane protein YeaQ/YmgE (transglycosylase-associated protein family)